MLIGVRVERAAHERRVALGPDAVQRLCRARHEIVVDAGAGQRAGLPDRLFSEAGATLGDPWDADVVAAVRRPDPDRLVAEQVLIGAQEQERFFPMLMMAAGTIPPAQVLVLGAGVAGFQAIATARRLGAVVTAFDVRAAVKEQVQSLGAKFLDVAGSADAETAGGYARESTEEEQQAQREALAAQIAKSDVVISTALVPGRPAPKLITADAVNALRPGSVIVDLAGEAGNCELTRPGETYATERGVIIAAPLNLPSSMPEHASRLYGSNVATLLELMTGERGALRLDFDDEIIAGACITRGGEIVHDGARRAAEQPSGASA